MKLIGINFYIGLSFLLVGCGQVNTQQNSSKKDTLSLLLSRNILVSDGCDGCELMYEGMPPIYKLSWSTHIAMASEVGKRLEIRGTIYQEDGKTPAPNVILYVYHTDAKGYYSPLDTQKVARRHGHLRGWMITNEKGEYMFETIKPASYPNTDNPAHIHPVVKEAGKIEYYFDEYLFDYDPKLTDEKRNKCENRGGSGIMQLTKDDRGIWVGKRDIMLGLNVPNYR